MAVRYVTWMCQDQTIFNEALVLLDDVLHWDKENLTITSYENAAESSVTEFVVRRITPTHK